MFKDIYDVLFAVVLLLAITWWFFTARMARGMYQNSLSQFHEAGDRLLSACKERDRLKSDLKLEILSKAALEISLQTETKRREEAEDRLARRIESESA